MVAEPTAAGLLLGLLADVAREGIPRLFDHLDRRYGTSEYDLSGGTPVTARVRFRFRAATGVTPYWVLLGMQARDGQRIEVPVRYGEPLEIVVPRAWYEVMALFLSRPLTARHKPTLLAVGVVYEGAIAARQQQVELVGRYPSQELVAWLDARVPPAKRPFRLPTPVVSGLATGLLTVPVGLRTGVPALPGGPPTGVLLPGVPPTRVPASLGGLPARAPGLAGGLATRPTRRVSPRTARPSIPGVPAPQRPSVVPTPPVPPQARPRPGGGAAPRSAGPAPAPAKPAPAPPPDGQCKARTRRGTRCQNGSEGARGNVCEMHLAMVAQGKTVLWHKSGRPIKLRKT